MVATVGVASILMRQSHVRWAALLGVLLALPAFAGSPAPAHERPKPAGSGFPLIAILTYHDLSADGATPLQTVSAEFLRAQIRDCRSQGWTFMRLSELIEHHDAGR